MRTSPLLALFVGLLAVSLVAACGDGDDDDQATEEESSEAGDDDDRLTHEEYFAEVDQLNADLDPAAEEALTANRPGEDEVDLLVSALHTYEEGLRALNPPEDLEELHDQYIDDVNAFIALTQEVGLEGFETDPFADLEATECELVGIAEESGIEPKSLGPEDAVILGIGHVGAVCGEEGGAGADDAGDNPVAVEATEFEFTFEDGAFTTETTGIVFTNAGEQYHEAFILRISEDAVIDELLASEEETPEGVEEEVGRTGAEPGEVVATGVHNDHPEFGFRLPLRAGRYLMGCYVDDPETGQEHALLGMIAEFTVE